MNSIWHIKDYVCDLDPRIYVASREIHLMGWSRSKYEKGLPTTTNFILMLIFGGLGPFPPHGDTQKIYSEVGSYLHAIALL